MEHHIDSYKSAVENQDRHFEYLKRNQITQDSSWQQGGIFSVHEGYVSTMNISAVHTPILVYFLKESKYHMSPEAYDIAMRAFEFFSNTMSEAGLMDFHMCNFETGPDTAFAIRPLADLYRMIEHQKTDNLGEQLRNKMYDLMIRMADGIHSGGFHTPNHRWVISSAMAMMYNITKDEKYLDLANMYLAEGIDCDEYGEYAERSTGGYNFINNEALLILAKELDKPEYLEYVRRNLILMSHYIDDSFSIFTQNSKRQDNGTKLYLDRYLIQYLKAGNLLNDEKLLGIAKALYDDILRNGRHYPIGLDQMLLNKELLNIPQGIESFKLQDYSVHYPNSKIARMRHKDMTISLLEDKTTFMYVNYKNFDLAITGGIMFFNERHIKVKDITPIENGFRMHYHGQGSYRKPFGAYQGTTDFWAMDNDKRDTTKALVVDMVIEVTKTDEGIKVYSKLEGQPRVSVRLDIAMNTGAFIKGENFASYATAGGIIMPLDSYVQADFGQSGLIFGPGKNQSYVKEGLWGSEPMDKDSFHIFYNYLAPTEHEFTITPAKKYAK